MDEKRRKEAQDFWKCYDPEDDVILPKNIFYEVYYIFCVLYDIIKNNCDRKKEWNKLKCQIRIYIRWLQVR